jgi:hypothetical protein
MYYQQPKFSNTVLTNQSLLELSDDLTLTNVSSIPEDVLEAETYYSQFENEFEDDEDLEDLDDSGGSEGTDEDNDEHSALINQLQAALELDAQDTILEEETIEERFSQTLRQQRITALRQYPFILGYIPAKTRRSP